MPYSSVAALPLNVRNVLTQDSDVETNRAIRAAFFLDQDQFDAMLDIVLGIILGKFAVLELPQRLASIPRANTLDIRALALRIAIDKLWPLQEFLKSVDVLINRLGGRLPAPMPLPAENASTDDDESDVPDLSVQQGPAKEIIQANKAFTDLYITQKPIRDSEGRLKAPTLNNWLQDYLHTVGASGVGSLKRSQYMARSANALSLNDAEKKNVLNFLVSYEEHVPMFWHTAEGQYLLIEEELPQTKNVTGGQEQPTKAMSELLGLYSSMQMKYQAMFEDTKKGLELEINGNTKKTADIVWDALGLGETERCLAALDLLIDHHWLLETLKTDHRFQGIVGRSIGVRYGIEAKNTWNGDLTTSVMLALFWKLILVEKLGIDEQTAAILADHYRKRLEQKVSPIYLDLTSGKFLFREIAYKDRVFSFI